MPRHPGGKAERAGVPTGNTERETEIAKQATRQPGERGMWKAGASVHAPSARQNLAHRLAVSAHSDSRLRLVTSHAPLSPLCALFSPRRAYCLAFASGIISLCYRLLSARANLVIGHPTHARGPPVFAASGERNTPSLYCEKIE